MQNELTRLRINENFAPDPRIHIQEHRRNHVQEKRIINDGTNKECRKGHMECQTLTL
jgi:hypothetical protein